MSVRRSNAHGKKKKYSYSGTNRSVAPMSKASNWKIENIDWKMAQIKWRQGEFQIWDAGDRYYAINSIGTAYSVDWSSLDAPQAQKFLNTASGDNKLMNFAKYQQRNGMDKSWADYQNYVGGTMYRPIPDDRELSREEFNELNGSDELYDKYLYNLEQDKQEQYY